MRGRIRRRGNSLAAASTSTPQAAAGGSAPPRVAAEKEEEKEVKETKESKKEEVKKKTGKTAEGEEEDFLLLDTPDEYICKISLSLIADPVLLAMDSFSYSRKGWEEWVKKCEGKSLLSPSTLKPLDNTFCMPNQTLKTLINDYIFKRRREFRAMKAEEGKDKVREDKRK